MWMTQEREVAAGMRAVNKGGHVKRGLADLTRIILGGTNNDREEGEDRDVRDGEGSCEKLESSVIEEADSVRDSGGEERWRPRVRTGGGE